MGKINIKPENKGKFTAWARAHGMSVQEAARHILANKDKYSATLIKRANFARNAAKWEDGGIFDLPEFKKGGWIQKATKSIKRRGTEGVCTGSKFGSSSCPPGSKRYNLAKTFRKMAKKRKKEDGGIMGEDEYGLGGFLQGLAPIAGLIPGVGSVASGLMSGVGGILSASEQNKAEKELANKQARDLARQSQSTVMNPYLPTFKVGGRFKGKRFGGTPNAEVEGGEVIITPDGESTNMSGASHAQGGMNVNLPTGSMIFSDKVKVGKGKTAADMVRPFTKRINDANEVIQGESTRLAKNTSKLKLNRYYKKAIDAFNKQESKKYQGGGWHAPLKLDYIEKNHPMAKWVWPFPKGTEDYPYEVAGTANVADILNPRNKLAKTPGNNNLATESGFNPSDFTARSNPAYNLSMYSAPDVDLGLNPVLGSLAGDGYTGMRFDNPLDLTDQAASRQQTFENSPFNKKGIKGLDILSTVGELAPTLYNLGQGLFGKREQIDPNRYRNPYEGKINSLMANRRYNIDPELAANEMAFKNTAYNLRNLGGSRGQVMSNLFGAQNTRQFGDMSAYATKKNMENQYAGEYANTLYGLGRDRVSSTMLTDDINAMNRAAGRNFTGSAMTGLQQYLLTRRQMKNQTARDRMLGDIFKNYSAYNQKWFPGVFEELKKYESPN